MLPSPLLGTGHGFFWSPFLGDLGSARIYQAGFESSLRKMPCGSDRDDNAMATGGRDLGKNADGTFLPGCEEGRHFLFCSPCSVWPSFAVSEPLQL